MTDNNPSSTVTSNSNSSNSNSNSSSSSNSNSNNENANASENWCLIESDPAVFTELIELFGCGDLMEVMELYSIEDDTMLQQSLQLIPDLSAPFDDQSTSIFPENPDIQDLLQLNCYGLIFLFEYNNAIQQQHGEMMMTREDMASSNDAAEATATANSNINDDDEPSSTKGINNIFFAQQITNNACATQAILSIILNTIPNGTVQPVDLGTTLSDFYSFTQELPPYYKGMAITSSVPIRTAHNSFTNTNDTFMALNQFDQRQKEMKEKGEAFHFVAYVPVNGTVYELDGLQKQPIVVGNMDDEEDSSSATTANTKHQWLSIARRAIQDRMTIIGADTGDVKFNLMAVTSNRLSSLQRVIDLSQGAIEATPDMANVQLSSLHVAAIQAKQIQEQIRVQYKQENQRRRHNYYNLILNVFKELQRMNQLEKCIKIAQDKQQTKRKRMTKK
jgi:ubiquitin carboxyl-terminal hydrolase L5